MTIAPGKTASAAVDQIDRPLRIVVLDDLEEVRAAHRVVTQLLFADADIVECEDGDEAWEILQKSPPNLFISDLTHPGLRVEEMLKRLAKEGLQFPILVVSAFQQGLDSLREQHRAQPHGLRGFLDKPFKLEELRAEIKRLISSGPEARK